MNSNEVAPEKQLISFSTSNCLLSIINNAYLFSFSERGLKSFSFSRSALYFPSFSIVAFLSAIAAMRTVAGVLMVRATTVGVSAVVDSLGGNPTKVSMLFAAQHILSCAGFIAAVGCENAFEALSHVDLTAGESCFVDHQKPESGS